MLGGFCCDSFNRTGKGNFKSYVSAIKDKPVKTFYKDLIFKYKGVTKPNIYSKRQC